MFSDQLHVTLEGEPRCVPPLVLLSFGSSANARATVVTPRAFCMTALAAVCSVMQYAICSVMHHAMQCKYVLQ